MGLAALRIRPAAFFGRTGVRAIAACLLSAAVTTVAASGTCFTTASEPVSLTFEPLSLLLTPGILCGMVLANLTHLSRHHTLRNTTHDYTLQAVLSGSLVFYSVFFFYALLRWSRRRAARTLTETAQSR